MNQSATPDGVSDTDDKKIELLITITTLVYVLQAVSFLIGISYIVGIVINYVKREDVQGTWLASHFRWQIRTFWFSLLWCALGVLTWVIVIGYFIMFATAVWVIYRIAKGWLSLYERKPMYALPATA